MSAKTQEGEKRWAIRPRNSGRHSELKQCWNEKPSSSSACTEASRPEHPVPRVEPAWLLRLRTASATVPRQPRSRRPKRPRGPSSQPSPRRSHTSRHAPRARNAGEAARPAGLRCTRPAPLAGRREPPRPRPPADAGGGGSTPRRGSLTLGSSSVSPMPDLALLALGVAALLCRAVEGSLV